MGIGFLAALGVLFAFPRFPLRTLALVVLVSALIAGVVQVVHTEAWFVAFWGRADSGRIELFHFMIKDWESCGWWLGCGLGYQSHDLLHGTEAIQHPHNIFVSFGIYTGLVSLRDLRRADGWPAWARLCASAIPGDSIWPWPC